MPRPSGPLLAPALALLTALLSPLVARAELPGVSLAARAGYAITFLDGEAVEGSRHLPLQLDVMAHLPLGFRAGLYGSYAPRVSTSGNADADKIRVGVQVHYRLPLAGVVHPWVGVGTGYVHTTDLGPTTADNSVNDGRPRTSTGASSTPRWGGSPADSGWELLNLQAGVQFSLLPRLELGPYAEYNLSARAKTGSSPAVVTLPTGPVSGVQTSGSTPESSRVMRLSFGLRAEFTF